MPQYCIYKGCAILAGFGYKNGTREYCKVHKKENMINLKNKICKEQDCLKQPSYGYKNAEYCAEHKKENMIDVRNKRCRESGCSKHPTFGNKEDRKKQYCAEHRKEGMIVLVQKRCKEPNCLNRPYYGNKGENKKLFCRDHKREDMINLNPIRCKYDGCEIIASFGNKEDRKKQYCVTHKTPDMVNLTYITCNSEWCDTRANRKYKNYCFHCYKNLFPDDPIIKNYKTKEREVGNYIRKEFDDIDAYITFDKTVGSSKKRPDICFKLKSCNHVVIIEIDEDCHSTYDVTCENKRICEIYQDLGFKKVVFIRFNPDTYTDESGKKIKSPWNYSKTGILSIKNKSDWSRRLEKLKEQVSYWFKTKPKKAITIEHLFFNEIEED